MTIDEIARGITALSPDRRGDFDEVAAAVQAFQRQHNPIYGRFDGEMLPVAAFKHAPVTSFPPAEAEHVFESSGSGRGVTSKHYIRRLELYERVVATHFEQVVGPGPVTLLAHLPHYTDRGEKSSLLYMLEVLIRRFGDERSAFFLDNRAALVEGVAYSRRHGSSLILFGAAFGLLDLVERGSPALPPHALVIETGGMKTYRREIGREELHRRLANGFGLPEERIWSEYGMCEMMSQCYTRGGAVFYPPPWVRFRVVDVEDPAIEMTEGRTGLLAVIDLANVYSASFLLTEDLAIRRGTGFEVLGRLSEADLRGCNFLVEQEKG